MKKLFRLCFLLAILALFVVAASCESSGTCGDNLTWTLDENGTLTISGTGAMEDFEWDSVPWYSSRNAIKTIMIEPGVTTIGDYAFYCCFGLTRATIPESVNSIGMLAFAICSDLTSVTIPSGVTDIGYKVFSGCTSVTSIALPDSVTSIGYCAFGGCTGLTDIHVDSANPEFTSKDGVLLSKDEKTLHAYPAGKPDTSYAIPSGVTTIGSDAFSDCSSLTDIAIPDSVTSIGGEAFAGCSSLTSITIPSGVTSIDIFAFSRCSSLTGINVESDNRFYTSADGVLLSKDGTTLLAYPAGKFCVPYTIPSGVTTIDPGAFLGCTGLEVITIPTSVTSIGYLAFSDCTGLREIGFKGDAPSISGDAFCNVTARVYYSYNDWTGEACQNYGGNLTWVAVMDMDPTITVPTIIDQGTCGDNLTWTWDDAGTLTISGTGEMANYEWNSKAPWFSSRGYIQKVVIEPGVTTIGDYAFYECMFLTSITIPDSVTSIGRSAILGCSSLTGIDVDSVNPAYCSMDGVLFSKDGKTLYAYPTGKSGTSYSIPSGVATIGDYAFQHCSRLTNVAIPESVTSIGTGAFANCTGLTGITIPDSVTSIGNSAFAYCSSLTGIVIPDSVTSIGGCAFQYCSGLTSVTLSSNITGFYTGTFACCSGLTSITIPASVRGIMGNNFANCTSLTSITFEGDAPRIPDFEFKNVTATVYYPAGNPTWTEEVRKNYEGNLTWVAVLPSVPEQWALTLPSGLTSIGEEAFRNDTSLTTVRLSSSCTAIGANAFTGCTALKFVCIPNGSCSIATNAFGGNTDVIIVTVPGSAAAKKAASMGLTVLDINS